MKPIDADELYKILCSRADQELDRLQNTPDKLPNGTLNPMVIDHNARLSEITNLIYELVDAPVIKDKERKTGMWGKIRESYCSWSCSVCKEIVVAMPEQMGYPLYDYCPNCGAYMREGD